MPMNTTKKLLLLFNGGAADTSASFTVTTTGAQTLTLHGLGVTSATTVDWGDGSSDEYTGISARTHDYAGAGTWTVRILEPLNVSIFDCRDAKVTIPAGFAGKMRNCGAFTVINIAKLSMNAGEITLLAATLSTLNLRAVDQSGVVIGAGEIGQKTSLAVLDVTGGVANMVIGANELGLLTNLITLNIAASNPGIAFQTGLANLLKLTTLRYEAGLTTAQVDSVLQQLWTGFASRTGTAGTVDLLGGSNQGPTGPVSAENPPTYGGAYAYELVNDTGNVNPTKKWVSVTTATPV